MVTIDRIQAGKRVIGKHGPLIANPKGGKRRIRAEAYGTVIRATEKGEWEVRFDFDQRRKTVRYNTLKVVPDEAGVPLHELPPTAQQGEGEEESTSSDTITEASMATPGLSSMESDRVSNFSVFSFSHFRIIRLTFFQDPVLDPSLLDSVEETEDGTGEDIDIQEEEEASGLPNNDFGQYTIDDILRMEDNVNISTIQNGKRREAWAKIKALTGTEVVRKSAKDGQIIWRVVDDVVDDKYSDTLEKEKEYLKQHTPFKNTIKDIQELFWSLWPGEVDDELRDFVQVVKEENITRHKKNLRPIQVVSFLFSIMFIPKIIS